MKRIINQISSLKLSYKAYILIIISAFTSHLITVAMCGKYLTRVVEASDNKSKASYILGCTDMAIQQRVDSRVCQIYVASRIDALELPADPK